MNKLLHAGFARLWKNTLFWILAIFSIGIALFMIHARYSDLKAYGDVIEVEQIMLNYSTIVGIVIAIFASLFLSAEYSDGVIRNKICVGHKRSSIYLSNLILTSAASLFSYILFVAIAALIGIPLFGTVTMPVSKLFTYLGCILAAILAYSSIFTLLAMMISNKAVTAVVSIMLAFGMMMAALTCLNTLSRQKYIQAGSMVDGEIQFEEILNPKYPSEEEKKVCQTVLDIVPSGQMFQLTGRIAPDLKVLPSYSFAILVVFTGAGIVLFQRKNIK